MSTTQTAILAAVLAGIIRQALYLGGFDNFWWSLPAGLLGGFLALGIRAVLEV